VSSGVQVAGSIENRIHRYWLQGPKRGTHEVFAVLPGVPDGIALAPDGGFWLALFAELPPLATYGCTRLEGSVIPFRAIVARLPRALLPRIRPVGMVAKLSSEGKVSALGRPLSYRTRTYTWGEVDLVALRWMTRRSFQTTGVPCVLRLVRWGLCTNPCVSSSLDTASRIMSLLRQRVTCL